MAQNSARGFRDLIAWQRAHELASKVYEACRHMPPQNRWLVDQMLRAAVSVPANIAEGHGRGSKAELARFLDIARGSLSELEYYLHFARAEGILAPQTVQELDDLRARTGKVLFGLWRSLQAIKKEDWDRSGRVRENSEIYAAC